MKAIRWLWLLLLVPVALGFNRLRFETEVLHLLPPDLPEVRGLHAWQEHFSAAGDLLIAVQSPDAALNSRYAEAVAHQLRRNTNLVAGAHWQPPWREQPGAIAELVAARWLNQAPTEVAALAARLDPARIEDELSARREQLAFSLSPDELARLSYDPLGLLELPGGDGGAAEIFGNEGPFAAPDGSLRVIHVQPAAPLTDYRQAEAWMNTVRHELDAVKLPDVNELPRLGFTGGPAFPAEIGRHMESDMKRSVTGTALVVAFLFGLVHRRLRPLLWLVTIAGLILLLTMAAGGLIFGRLSVVSLGFAAILLGLVVDYGLVLYQERLAGPDRDWRMVRREVAPGIWWSALTTAGAFALLNFAGLPGLAQLGTLVAVGILIGAALILALFLGPLDRRNGAEVRASGRLSSSERIGRPVTSRLPVAGVSFVVLLLAVGLVIWNPPVIDASSAPLRLADSPAYDTLDEVRSAIGGEESWSLLVAGKDESEVAASLIALDERLRQLRAEGEIESYLLPTDLIPSPAWQRTNRELLRAVVDRREALLAAAGRAGFSEDSLRLAGGILDTWQRALVGGEVFWPGNDVSRWVLDRSVARDANGLIAAGMILPAPGNRLPAWADELQSDRVMIASWERLGPALLASVELRLTWVLAAILLGLGVALGLTFGNVREALLCLVTLGASGVLLQAVMSLAGWSWNLMNLMAVPLLIGATVDYSIHVQLSLRRHRGDGAAVFRATSRALLLCAATTATGFGTLAMSRNAGLASLGQTCASGALCAVLVACFFLPAWWRKLVPAATAAEVATHSPSRLYGQRLWQLGMLIAARLPLPLVRFIAAATCLTYAAFATGRRHMVAVNILPVVKGDQALARRLSWRMFQRFGIKLADLLAYEGGRPITGLFLPLPENRLGSLKRTDGRGVLLLTVHLGNWEFGAPILIQRGVKLLVISQAEPGDGFTELRERARARWGIETLIVGNDAFAFVEVLKRLQSGETVALLMDRPPTPSGVEVELFDRPFAASISAAELARASGCVLLPVAIPWTPAGYEVLCLDEIGYDRAGLGNRAARQALTQEIIRAFEPVIRQHPDQWFHFVPIWK